MVKYTRFRRNPPVQILASRARRERKNLSRRQREFRPHAHLTMSSLAGAAGHSIRRYRPSAGDYRPNGFGPSRIAVDIVRREHGQAQDAAQKDWSTLSPRPARSRRDEAAALQSCSCDGPAVTLIIAWRLGRAKFRPGANVPFVSTSERLSNQDGTHSATSTFRSSQMIFALYSHLRHGGGGGATV